MKRTTIGRILLNLSLVLASTLAWAGENKGGDAFQVLSNPTLYYLDHYDVSPPLRDMPVLTASDEAPGEVDQLKLIRPAQEVPKGWVDPLDAASKAPSPQVSVTTGLNFDGVGVGLGSYSPNVAPPDTQGSVGATQYVQWVNLHFAVFNKSTGALQYGPAAGNTLWQGFGGPCESTNSGDPITLYDKAAQRWWMTQFSINTSTATFYQCVAVSTTSDATGTWRRFAYQFSAFNDYPKGGVWPDGYYLSFNMFNSSGTAFLGAQVCALDRNQMVTTSGTPGPIQCFQLSSAYGGLLPSDLDGATAPPAGSPNYFLNFGTNSLNLWKFKVNWATPSLTTFTGPTNISVAAFSAACGGGRNCVEQTGTTQKLDGLADRLMYRLAYRNFGSHESLVVNHSVTGSTATAGVRWYELRSPNTTPTVYQQGTFSPDSTSRWMGSIAQDQQGNMALGYSASSTSINPAIRYTGRLVGDTLGTMQAENTLWNGSGSQTGGLSRWGDYSSMSIDPADDCTFWYTTEYLKTSGSFNWSTRIGSFKFPSCGGTPTPDFSLSVSPTSLSIAQGASGNATVTVTSINGFSSAVTLSAAGLPSGVTASFAPNPVTPPSGGSAGSTLTLTASSSATTGTFSVTISGVSGALSHTTALTLTVTPTGGGGNAVYDAVLKAPKCASVGNSCDTGASLVLGRDNMSGGIEPNQPNTINSSCADGTAGTFHNDESNDRLKVYTLDGSSFAPGKTVRIEATVWAWPGSPTSDAVDLYYAADANAPVWTYVTTIVPGAGGAQVLSATYTLPSGSLQAVRANFRYLGSASSCSTGSYDDRDDLVFAVGGGPADNFAVYDGVLRAPKCATAGKSCDSGASLLLGRDTMSGGAEPNQPNTINNSCADGVSGSFHVDESNDRIKVLTLDGSALAAGKTVRIEATVWAWPSSPTSDALDLYYTASAAAPSWTYLTTIVPTVGGSQVLSATYTLPAGTLQAVRAHFRYVGSATSCSTGSYDDHDDLIFAVQ